MNKHNDPQELALKDQSVCYKKLLFLWLPFSRLLFDNNIVIASADCWLSNEIHSNAHTSHWI